MSLYRILNIIISDSANCFLIFPIPCSKLLLKHLIHSLNLCIIVRLFSFYNVDHVFTFLSARSRSEGQEIFNLNVAICKENIALNFLKETALINSGKWKLGRIWHKTLNVPLTLLLNLKGPLHSMDFKLQKHSPEKSISPCLYN